MTLSHEQKRQACAILSIGCDRLTAAKYLGCSLADLRQAMRDDSQSAARIRRAEAAVEMHHMRNVHNAARDEKHWRASVWWLERCAPDRYGRRDPHAMTAPQLEAFVAQLVAAIGEEVRDAADVQRLIDRLERVVQSLALGSPRAEPNCLTSEPIEPPRRATNDDVQSPVADADADTDDQDMADES